MEENEDESTRAGKNRKDSRKSKAKKNKSKREQRKESGGNKKQQRGDMDQSKEENSKKVKESEKETKKSNKKEKKESKRKDSTRSKKSKSVKDYDNNKEAKLERMASTGSKQQADKDKTLPYYDALELDIPELVGRKSETKTPIEVETGNQNIPSTSGEKEKEIGVVGKDGSAKREENKEEEEKKADKDDFQVATKEEAPPEPTLTDKRPSLITQTSSSAKLVTYTQQKVFTKDLDIVIFGATGFTGRLACLYLADHPDKALVSDMHIAIAGRNKKNLNQIRNEMVGLNSFMGRVSVLTADAFVTDELDKITSKTRVLLNFAGPYSWFGSQVVESCVRNMCHYVDLSLELPWVMKMIGKHGPRAVKNKTRVVNACGFYSVMSDLGILSVVNHVKNMMREEPMESTGLIHHAKSGVSGQSGPESMLDNFKNDNKQYYEEMMADPQYYTPTHLRTGRDPPDPANAVYMKDLRTWTSPSLTAPVNSRVVRRSGAVLSYGDKFTYTEMVMNANWMSAKLSSSKLSWNATGGGSGVKHGDRVDPSKAFKKLTFEVNFFAKCSNSLNKHVVCTVKGKGDPIYEMTSRIMVEAGILMSKFQESLPMAGKESYGFHTPATALGFPLRERLKQYANVSFSVEELDVEG